MTERRLRSDEMKGIGVILTVTAFLGLCVVGVYLVYLLAGWLLL